MRELVDGDHAQSAWAQAAPSLLQICPQSVAIPTGEEWQSAIR